MKYSQQEIIQYVQEEDVKFIRLAFCDVFGKQKNISIMPDELQRAFSYGIAIDASAIDGFGDETHSDLFLHPEPDTLMPLPWRPEEGSVVRMFCHITHQDGTPFEYDSRALLEKAIKAASEEGLQFSFGTEQEFYLFRSDDFGEPTMIPYPRFFLRNRISFYHSEQRLFRMCHIGTHSVTSSFSPSCSVRIIINPISSFVTFLGSTIPLTFPPHITMMRSESCISTSRSSPINTTATPFFFCSFKRS